MKRLTAFAAISMLVLGCQRGSTTSPPETTTAAAVESPPVSEAQKSASGPFAVVEIFTSEG